MAHDPSTPHNFTVSIVGHEGALVRAQVRLENTVPAGGITLDVLYDPRRGVPVSVRPWRNLGQFVMADLAAKTGGRSAH